MSTAFLLRALTSATLSDVPFSKILEKRLAVLKGFDPCLRHIRTCANHQFVSFEGASLLHPLPSTAVIGLRVLTSVIPKMSVSTLSPELVSVAQYIGQLSPLSLYREWAPRSSSNDLVSMKTTLDDLARWAISLCNSKYQHSCPISC